MAKKLQTIGVELNLGAVKLQANWAPTKEERCAAWDLYVELTTRVATQPLGSDDGLIREALASHHELFAVTRTILKSGGPQVARPQKGSDCSLAHLAIAALNLVVRPLLNRWHPELQDHEDRRSASTSRREHERAWSQASEARSDLASASSQLLDFARLLAAVSDVPHLLSDLTERSQPSR